MIASVEGMISAAPMPMLARAAISIPTEPEKAAHVEQAANATKPARNVRLRPTRSARLPDDEHQPGEQHDVGVDDPLQIARAGVQLAHERRQGDVQDGAVERDDQQRHAQHGQREPVSRRNGLPRAVLDPSRPFVE